MPQNNSDMELTDVPGQQPQLTERRPAISWRSILLGLLGVILICGFTPFNDFVLGNTLAIGGSLPLAGMLFIFLFAVFINGPLNRFAPRLALQTNELTVVLVMILVTSVLPSSGLMRYWMPTVAGSWRHMGEQPAAYDEVLARIGLPDWFWTSFPENEKTVQDRAANEVIRFFGYEQMPADIPSSIWRTIFLAWVKPTLGWGVFFVCMFGSVLGLSFILRRQWVENERITFPLAQIQMALVETPAPRRFLNDTLASRTFWVAMGIIVAIRLLNGLYVYWPKAIPQIPMRFDMASIMADPPWSYTDRQFQNQEIYPLLAAIAFFVSTRISFSLWVCMALWQIPQVVSSSAGIDISTGNKRDVNFGALVAFAIMILWTGRQHYAKVLRIMFTPARQDEETGQYIHYRTAGWMVLLGAIGSIAWLMQVKMSLLGAFLLVAGLLLIWLVMANVVAHCGFLSASTLSGPREWFVDIFRNPDPKNAYKVTDVSNNLIVQLVGGMWAYTTDQIGIYTTHGLKVATEFAPKAGRRLLWAIVLAMLIGFVVSEASTILCYYNFSATLDKNPTSPINKEVMEGQPKWAVEHTLNTMHKKGQSPSHKDLTSWSWALGGFSLTGLLAFLQLRYTWWPLHPIGLLMLFAYVTKRVWFSVFLGWLVKSLIVRFGGAKLFRNSRPFFMGIIIGEVVAAGGFAIAALVLYLLGIPYEPVKFLPVSQF